MDQEIAVQYNYLGKTGLRVSNVCFGTMTFGKHQGGPFNFFDTPTHSNEEMAHKLLDRFVELGGNLVDTADIYSGGASEKVIGNWFLSKNQRDNIILATKARFATKDKGPNNIGLSRRHITQALNGSLERLQTSYIDLYQAHGWDNATPVEETLRTFDDLVRCGKIHYYGYSNLCGWQLQQVVDTARNLGISSCLTLQQQYTLLHRESEWEPFMVCQNEGIGILPWSPLTGGMLTGKFKRGVIPDPGSSRMGYMYSQKAIGQLGAWANYSDNEQYWKIIDLLRNISAQHKKTVAQVALKWLLQKKCVVSVIIGATSFKQLEENMEAGGTWELTDDEVMISLNGNHDQTAHIICTCPKAETLMYALDKVSPNYKPYPYDMLWNATNAGRYNDFHEKSVKIPKTSI